MLTQQLSHACKYNISVTTLTDFSVHQ